VCEVKPEIKTDHCLIHRQSISHCLTVTIMNGLRLSKYFLHEITSLPSSADVRNAWRYTSILSTLLYMVFNYTDFFTFTFHL